MDKRDLSRNAFWSTFASLFVLLLAVDLYLYVPQDAMATAIGSLVGIYVFGLILWWLIWLAARKSAPRRRRFVTILAVLGFVATLIQQLLLSST